MRGEIIKEIEQILPAGQILRREPMSRHTTFRVGGPAELFLEIRTASEIQKLLTFFQESGTKYFIVGNGSNLLVSDGGYDGAILHIGEGFDKIGVVGEKVRAQAGALLGRAALTAQQNSLTGLEFAFGIPGSVGGAAVMNAGAYGGEMSQVVTQVRVVSREGEVMELDNSTMEFGYRTSVIKKHPLILTECVFLLKQGNKEEIAAKMADFQSRRKEKQPLEYPSAGSTFKRPAGYFAGKLIMDAGLAGYRIGGAEVSAKHCGFIINTGDASAADIRSLISYVQEEVYRQFHVQLEPEVLFLGDF